MLTKSTKATKYPSSISKPSEALAGSCSRLKRGLPPPEKLGQNTTTSEYAAGLEAAQKLIARIAVRIVTAKREQANE